MSSTANMMRRMPSAFASLSATAGAANRGDAAVAAAAEVVAEAAEAASVSAVMGARSAAGSPRWRGYDPTSALVVGLPCSAPCGAGHELGRWRLQWGVVLAQPAVD